MIGELQGVDVKRYKFPGPEKHGQRHEPDARAARLRRLPQGAGSEGGAARAARSSSPTASCTTRRGEGRSAEGGQGDRHRPAAAHRTSSSWAWATTVDEEQMEDICHEEYPGVGHLWCHRVAEEISQVAELVAVLVDETMTVAAGGTIYDDRGKVLKIYEGAPARGARVRRARGRRELHAGGQRPALHPAAAGGRAPRRRGRRRGPTTDGMAARSRRSKPFSDVHRRGNKVAATLLHDPTVEGLDVALYMDGSASMEDEYGPRGILAKLGGGAEPGRAADALDARVPGHQGPRRRAAGGLLGDGRRRAARGGGRPHRARRRRTTSSPARSSTARRR